MQGAQLFSVRGARHHEFLLPTTLLLFCRWRAFLLVLAQPRG